MNKLNEPLNAQERFLYAIAIRLDAIIEQNNSIIEHLSKDGKVAVEEVKVEEKVVAVPVAAKRQTRKKVE